jgi:hypothetical protein
VNFISGKPKPFFFSMLRKRSGFADFLLRDKKSAKETRACGGLTDGFAKPSSTDFASRPFKVRFARDLTCLFFSVHFLK